MLLKEGHNPVPSAASEGSGRGPIPGILEKPLAGVAELADAQDLGLLPAIMHMTYTWIVCSVHAYSAHLVRTAYLSVNAHNLCVDRPDALGGHNFRHSHRV
jgi:hypothetical protein